MRLGQHLRTLGSLAASAVIVASLVTGTAGASHAKAPAGTDAVSSAAQLSPDVAATVRGTGVDAREQALSRYWTPERMKAALPDSELPAMKAAQAAAPKVGALATKPQGPSARIDAAAPATQPQATDTSGVSPQAYYPNYPVGHPVARTYGKVFFTSAGLNYVCSGTIVNTEGKSTVWTAAHCNTSNLAWHYNWTFVPNYSNGSAPYGNWYAYQLWATTAFFNNNNDFANDVGAAIMNRSGGWRITDYLGGQGIAWNYAIGQYMYAFGYPQGAPFNGCCLVGENGASYNGGGGTVFMVNYMTGGSSGGAWLFTFDGNWGYINGHNDFKYNNAPQYMYSPYYGNQVASLYNTVRNIST